MKINLDDCKYTLVIDEPGEASNFYAKRHGEVWRDLTGDKLVLAMAHEIERLRGQFGVAVALLNECVGPIEVSAAVIEGDFDSAAMEALIARAKQFVNAALGVNPCPTCNGTGVVDDGEITGSGGAEFTNGPIKCFTDCPTCRGNRGVRDTRACTCYPDETRPAQCQRKFALSECRAAAGLPDLFPPGGNAGVDAAPKTVDQAQQARNGDKA